MPDLKAHPAFKDIDWVAISDPEFKGAVPLMDALVKAENEYHENKANESLVVPKAPMIDADKSPKNSSNFSLGGKNDLRIVQQGYLNKRNWLGKEQLRYFELYSSGQIKYYESKKNEREYKDSAYIDDSTTV